MCVESLVRSKVLVHTRNTINHGSSSCLGILPATRYLYLVCDWQPGKRHYVLPLKKKNERQSAINHFNSIRLTWAMIWLSYVIQQSICSVIGFVFSLALHSNHSDTTNSLECNSIASWTEWNNGSKRSLRQLCFLREEMSKQISNISGNDFNFFRRYSLKLNEFPLTWMITIGISTNTIIFMTWANIPAPSRIIDWKKGKIANLKQLLKCSFIQSTFSCSNILTKERPRSTRRHMHIGTTESAIKKK